MSTTLIPLANITPRSARTIEAEARRRYANREDALDAAQYRIDVAPGCHSRPYFDPPVVGWVLTRAAARALCDRPTHMPGGTSHHRMSCGQIDYTAA